MFAELLQYFYTNKTSIFDEATELCGENETFIPKSEEFKKKKYIPHLEETVYGRLKKNNRVKKFYALARKLDVRSICIR